MEIDRQFKGILILIAGALITIGLVVAAKLTFGENANYLIYAAMAAAEGTVCYRYYTNDGGDNEEYTRVEIVMLLLCGLVVTGALIFAGFFANGSDRNYSFFGAIGTGSTLLYTLYNCKVMKPSKVPAETKETKPKEQ